MTGTEVKKIIAVMMAAYPNYKPDNVDIVVNVWADMLREYTYEQVNRALKAYILSDTSGFAPGIGQIVEKLQLFVDDKEINDMAAWQMVLKAMRNAIYHSEEEFANLPPIVQKAVVGPGQLREWAMAEGIDGTWMNVTQSNFMRAYRAEIVKEKEMRKLSSDLLSLVGRNAEKISADNTESKVIPVGEVQKQVEQNYVPIPERLRKKYMSLISKVV